MNDSERIRTPPGEGSRKNPRSLPEGPAIGITRRRRSSLRQHLRPHSARLAGAFLGSSLGRERLREIVGVRMVGQLPGMRGR